jgi:hypothetical protein
MTKLRLLIYLVPLALVAGIFIAREKFRPQPSLSSMYRCPDDYSTFEESAAAFDGWTKTFFDDYPDASLGDLSRARRDFYVEHNCAAALKRYDDHPPN